MVKFHEIDRDRSEAADKLSKSRKIVKNPKKKTIKAWKVCKRLSVWRNVYQSTNFLLIKYDKLELPDSFPSSFC